MVQAVKLAVHRHPALAERRGNADWDDGSGRGSLDAPPATGYFQGNEGEKFLRIISQAARIRRHYELFQLLQGEIQYFIPHQILICAWGDFGGPNLNLDVVSAIAGVRTDTLSGCRIETLLKRLYSRWLARGRQPMLIDGAAAEIRTFPACVCALHKSLQRMRSILVHGIHDARDGTDSLYLAAHEDSIVNESEIERVQFVIGSVITQIDVAFRRVTGLKSLGTTANEGLGALSAREKEVLAWVSEGRTNREISTALAISTFTVKNHVQRIIKKLGATNRTEAAAKYRRMAISRYSQVDPQARRTALSGEAGFAAK
jgi:transcriptional regulator EpsA